MSRGRPYQIVYEDNHLLIVNKAAGVLVQGDGTRDKSLVDFLKGYVKDKYEKPGEVFLHPVHRLDRPVSGLVVFARTSKALERMNAIFRKREIQKTYWAVVGRRPDDKDGKLVNWLVKDEKRNQVEVFDREVDGSQKAELTYRWLGEVNKFHLLEVSPITGRPHQIRAQLAHMGCPIRGDVKYGFPKFNPENNINLHARRLFFEHPVKKEPVLCRAGVPLDPFWEEFLSLDKEEIKLDNMKWLHE